MLYRDQDTGSEHYRGDELARQLQRAGTSLAFVNACYTDQAAIAPGDGPGVAQSLTGIVPVVIAMRDAVRDRDAKDFAETFYQWLLNGSTVDEAVARAGSGLTSRCPAGATWCSTAGPAAAGSWNRCRRPSRRRPRPGRRWTESGGGR